MYKRFCKRFLCLCLVLAVISGGLVFAVDPFYHYRVPKDYTNIIYMKPYYQNIGIVKNAVFDTVITGSSMMQNYRANWFDNALGCKAINLSFDGGSINAYKTFFDEALKGDKIKTIFFGLDINTITGEKNDAAEIPGYLADSNPFNDASYLFNKNVIFNQMINLFSNKFSKKYDFYKACAWDAGCDFSEESVLKSYNRIENQADEKSGDCFTEHAESVTSLLMDCIVNNPETEFVLFIPPYSILFWDNMVRKGSLDATICSLKYAYKELLQCSNVKLFCFLDIESIITDLDLYKDCTHYCPDVNRFMLECYTQDKYELAERNVDKTLDSLKKFAAGYDYESIFAQSGE